MENATIKNVSDFVETLLDFNKESNKVHSPTVHCLTFYRGQANVDWGLSPRLYREGLFDKEGVLISEFLRIAPKNFERLSYFDILEKMQHYGLPTRLLDATQNPLVALFFACFDKSNIGNDGVVFVLSQLPVFKQGMNDIVLIMNYVFEYSGYALDIQAFSSDIISSKKIQSPYSIKYKSVEDILRPLIGAPFYAILPKLNNQRILNQDGAFLLFGMNVKKIEKSNNPGNAGTVYYHFAPKEFNNAIENFWGNSKIIRVPSIYKNSILEELELLGVTNNKMFPELEYQSEFITNMIRKEIQINKNQLTK